MITITNTQVYGLEDSLRGMRNPKESWDRSDTIDEVMGTNDHKLAMDLVKGGREHCKFRRMIYVTCDICAPAYWWKDMDTYKVGTTANSTSSYDTMKKRPFYWSDFSTENLSDAGQDALVQMIKAINDIRQCMFRCGGVSSINYMELSALLPMSYNYLRTWSANYEVLANIYRQRRNHRLQEFRDFCRWVEDLPNSDLIIGMV